jgi:hypothetical protein
MSRRSDDGPEERTRRIKSYLDSLTEDEREAVQADAVGQGEPVLRSAPNRPDRCRAR